MLADCSWTDYSSTCLIYLVYLLNNTAAHRLSDLLSAGCLQSAFRLLPTGVSTGIEPISKLADISQNEFRPDPLCHRRLRQIPENFVHMDLFTPDPPRLPHDGKHLYRSHAAPSLQLELCIRESVHLSRYTQPKLQPLGFLLLLLRCSAAGQPDWARPMWPRMGVQQGDFPEYNSHRGTVGCWHIKCDLFNHRWKVCNFNHSQIHATAWKQVESVVKINGESSVYY